jgi:hypothetical protein
MERQKPNLLRKKNPKKKQISLLESFGKQQPRLVLVSKANTLSPGIVKNKEQLVMQTITRRTLMNLAFRKMV